LEASSRLRRDIALFVGFSLLFALLPIGKHVLELFNKGELHTWWDVFSSGELNYIAAALLWVSVGDFLKKRQTPLTSLQLAAVGASGLILFVEGYLWVFVGGGFASAHPAEAGGLCIGPLTVSVASVLGILGVESQEAHK
jgi:hypothetical protein